MIKALAHREDGTPLLILGLSVANLMRLPKDQPILILAKEMIELGAPKMDLILLGGETEEDILADIRKVFGVTPTTRIVHPE